MDGLECVHPGFEVLVLLGELGQLVRRDLAEALAAGTRHRGRAYKQEEETSSQEEEEVENQQDGRVGPCLACPRAKGDAERRRARARESGRRTDRPAWTELRSVLVMLRLGTAGAAGIGGRLAVRPWSLANMAGKRWLRG
jgi:hypothetical protein